LAPARLCSATTVAIWPQSPLADHLDAVSFSCQTGVRKPDSGAYLVAAAALQVPTGECVYVGDGADHELSGAEAVGMRTVRFRSRSLEDLGDDPGSDLDPDWSGPTISDLGELVGMIGLPLPRKGSESRTFVSGNVVPWGSKRSSR